MKLLAAFSAAALATAAAAQPAPDPTDIRVPTVAQLTQLRDACVWVQQVRVEPQKKASAVKAAASLLVGGLLGRPVGATAAAASAPLGADSPEDAASQPDGDGVKPKAGDGVVWDLVVVDKEGVVRRIAPSSDPQLMPGDVACWQDGRLARP